MNDGTGERWFGDSGVMKRGPFVVADAGVGPLITQRGHLVLYVVDSGLSEISHYFVLARLQRHGVTACLEILEAVWEMSGLSKSQGKGRESVWRYLSGKTVYC